MTTLLIDTAGSDEVSVVLQVKDKEYVLREKVGRKKAQEVLPMIDRLLQENSLTLDDITGISVNAGPGSYTGLRVGISIANALGFLLNIPVNGLPVGKSVTPVYS